MFYQPDVEPVHKLEHRDRSRQLSDHEVSGGMDQRRRGRRHPAANESRHGRSIGLSLSLTGGFNGELSLQCAH